MPFILFFMLIAANFAPGESSPFCNENQTYTECGFNGCQNTCSNPNVAIVCRPAPGCFPGCICADGFIFNSTGSCVLPSDCDNCRGDPTKVWNPCGNVCPVTCENKDVPIACIEICFLDGACVCREGLVEFTNGKCCSPDQCPKEPKCSGRHEHRGCGPACDTECKSLGKPCPIINKKCVDRCYCDDGYARDENGICIPINKCPNIPECSGPHEHFDCGSACDTECATLGQICPIINIKCNERCYCDDGFARDSNGICIPISQCPGECKPKCTGPNEHFACGSACDTECATLGQECPIINVKCNEMCYCNKGFARNSKGICIPITQCPKIKPPPCGAPIYQ